MTFVREALEMRFQHEVDVLPAAEGNPVLEALAARGACRHFRPEPVRVDTLRMLAALALSTPTKSDLQQRDIVLVTDPEIKATIQSLIADQAWTAGIPSLVIFCGNHARQQELHAARQHPFVNDHLDAFFNAAVDAGIAMTGFTLAAEAMGLGCCPISAVRNRAAELDRLLGLPQHVFPVVGLAVGWPVATPRVSQRLPLSATVHENRFDASSTQRVLEEYDASRARRQPYATQRREDELGRADPYTWSEDKTRQYSSPEREDFGCYIRRKGFNLS